MRFAQNRTCRRVRWIRTAVPTGRRVGSRVLGGHAVGIRGFHNSIPFTTSRSHLPEGGFKANPNAQFDYVRIPAVGSMSSKLRLLKFVRHGCTLKPAVGFA
jgi:hypothetical protein